MDKVHTVASKGSWTLNTHIFCKLSTLSIALQLHAAQRDVVVTGHSLLENNGLLLVTERFAEILNEKEE